MQLHVLTDHAVKPPACWRCISKKRRKSKARIENLVELVTATRQFELPEEAQEMTMLSAFCPMRHWKPMKAMPMSMMMRYS